mgnify:CR=1 FL=1
MIETPELYFLVLEFHGDGTLDPFSYLNEDNHADPIQMSEHYIQKIIKSVLQALGYLHRHRMIHGDVKPANILLNGNNDDDTIVAKLADFGLCSEPLSIVDQPNPVNGGTPYFCPPEVFEEGGYQNKTCKADVYALGVTLWSLFDDPFRGEFDIDSPEQFAGLLAQERGPWGDLSDFEDFRIRDFIASAVCYDVDNRASVEDLLSSSFMKAVYDKDILNSFLIF